MSAKTVKLIVPITNTNLNQSRGVIVKNQVEFIQTLCSNDLEALIQAVQPVVTRAPLNDEFELENI